MIVEALSFSSYAAPLVEWVLSQCFIATRISFIRSQCPCVLVVLDMRVSGVISPFSIFLQSSGSEIGPTVFVLPKNPIFM